MPSAPPKKHKKANFDFKAAAANFVFVFCYTRRFQAA